MEEDGRGWKRKGEEEKRKKEERRGAKRRIEEAGGDKGRLRKIGRCALLLRLKTQYNDTPFCRN